MTLKRWGELMNDIGGDLTPEEVGEGWHWCLEQDGLLVGPGMEELEWCHCFSAEGVAVLPGVAADGRPL